MIRIRPRSLRGRLVLGATAVGLTFAVLFGGAATWRIHHAEDEAIDAALQSRLQLAREWVARDGSLTSNLSNPKAELVQVLASDGTVLASSPALHGVGPLADPTGLVISPRGVRSTVRLQSPDVDLATLAVPWPFPPTDRTTIPAPAELVVALDTEGFTTANDNLTGVLVAGLAVVVLVLAALAWAVTGRALRSVNRLTESAERIQPPNRPAGLPVPEGDAELGRLVQALNRMLTRLHDSHTAELAFAANAGHRLRTPVAALRAEAELALLDEDPDRRTAALRQIITDADHLTLIVNRMLARGRDGATGAADGAGRLDQAADRWRRQAVRAAVDLRVDAPASLPRQPPAEVLVEVLDPIVDNAVRHTPPAGRVRVTVRLDPAGQLMAEVSNTGRGVPPELAPHIFEAWVSTRDGSEAGGLGLWVAREMARDLGGDVRLEATEASGTTRFRVQLPICR